ncbi:8016_t:CDS:10 [Ambispora gerdemannii]|uniref:8016_t:CDS:1 n=1 Tax=Ambispora gerdemannii TaxID=144530 RepID=A0A9N9D2C5_9GLOM|nr:8016_t:CDS:10 [Ambispora gerdemannii]
MFAGTAGELLLPIELTVVFAFEEKQEVNVTYGEYFTLEDNTIVIRVTRQKNDTCLEPEISLRILGPIGNVTEVKLNYEIPEFNFCIQNYQSYTVSLRQMNKYLLATYLDTDDFKNFERKAILFTRDGEVKGNPVILSPKMTSPMNSNVDITEHFLGINGHLFINSYNEHNHIAWTQLSQIDQSGNFRILRSGTFNENNTQATVFPTLDGSFALAYIVNSTHPTDILSQFVDPQWTAQVAFLRLKSDKFTSPFLLYQTELKLAYMALSSCINYSDKVGYGCLLQLASDGSGKNGTDMWLEISFLSAGGITNITNMQKFLNNDNRVVGITSLFYGGYLVYLSKPNGNETWSPYMEGVIYDIDRNRNSTLNFPNNVQLTFVSGILGNYSFWSLSNNTNKKSWTIVTTELPRFLSDQGYFNTKVETTYPAINDSVKIGTTNINITFTDKVKLSTNQLSIYKYDSGEVYRQFVIADSEYCKMSDDGRTVSITVLSSTFNQGGGYYYVQVEDNFVQDFLLEEPMHGISGYRWIFKPVTGLLRLNSDGTQKYKNSNGAERQKFYDELLVDLSIVTPIDISRLKHNYGFQYQTDAPEEQILLSVKILAGNPSEMTVKEVADTMDELIRHKDISPISVRPPASYLDETYGFNVYPNFWELYKLQLVGGIIGFVVVVGLYFAARRAYHPGNNLAIFQFVIIIIDFIFDVLFIKFNGKDVPSLYLPSIVILTATMGINLILASRIIVHENHTNLDFHQWFSRYGRLCSLFSVLSITDIEALQILSSRFAGLDFLSATYSDQAQNWLFWGSVCGLLLEDIPQLVIQIIYRFNVITWDIVPFIAIGSCVIVVFVKLIEKIFFAIQVCKKPRHQLPPTHYLNAEHIDTYPNYQLPQKEVVDPSDSSTVVMSETDTSTATAADEINTLQIVK